MMKESALLWIPFWSWSEECKSKEPSLKCMELQEIYFRTIEWYTWPWMFQCLKMKVIFHAEAAMMCPVPFYNCCLLRHTLIFEYFLRWWETCNLSKGEVFLSGTLVKFLPFQRTEIARKPLAKSCTFLFNTFSTLVSEKQDVSELFSLKGNLLNLFYKGKSDTCIESGFHSELRTNIASKSFPGETVAET